jgi:F-type H+-transporting ATPase subunit alpha
VEVKHTDLISLFERSLAGLGDQNLEEVGFVIQVGDAHCKIHGLTHVVFGELVEFEGGNKGIVLNIDEESATAFLLYNAIPVAELEVVKRTGGVFKINVGQKMLGRVINALGNAIDGLGEMQVEQVMPIETTIPGIVERTSINQSLETGILAIDALVPIGRGQRELIIGNRSTGKTALATDIILHQRDKNVICIYVSIGQRQAHVARIMQLLQEHDAMSYCVIMSSDASEPALNRYLAPYAGCTVAEYFRDLGKDVLIIYDDLSNHAIAYREMSLLMRRSPGREAYPGDVFYLHSRLLERAGRLLRGGSITALPVVQVQSDDITAYIPTNLISITDGQIFLDTKLFNNGIRPGVNVELSVSRVGGAAQTKAIKQVTQGLRLDIAQYHELLGFSQFGTELDELSQKHLARGAIVIELLKQPQYITYSFVDQVFMFFLLQENYLDKIDLLEVKPFAVQFVSYVSSVYPDIYETIKKEAQVSDSMRQRLHDAAREFAKVFGVEK